MQSNYGFQLLRGVLWGNALAHLAIYVVCHTIAQPRYLKLINSFVTAMGKIRTPRTSTIGKIKTIRTSVGVLVQAGFACQNALLTFVISETRESPCFVCKKTVSGWMLTRIENTQLSNFVKHFFCETESYANSQGDTTRKIHWAKSR